MRLQTAITIAEELLPGYEYITLVPSRNHGMGSVIFHFGPEMEEEG